MKEHPCSYYQCPEEGTIHIGVNGGDSHWICFRHLEKWNADRDRFLADGGGCEMQRLGELLDRQTEQINDGELQGFVRRALSFAKP